MPDLTIKPNAGSGNKVIIQDQAGAAVLTTADSGATLGNSTQDNITRLGTVTTGNLSNTAIVYPSGHVLEVKYMESASSSGNQTVSTSVFYGFGDVISMSVPTGQSVMMQVSGGLHEFDVHHDHGPCVNWDLTTFSTATQGTFGFNTGTNSNSKQIIGPVMAKYSNSSGSTTTLYVRAGMRGWSSGGTTAAWYGDATIALKRFFQLTRFMT